MRRELTLTYIVILILSCLDLTIASSVLAAKEKVIIGYISPPGKSDEDDIAAKGGKVKHRYQIIPAIAAEIDEAEVGKIEKQPKVKYIEPDYEVHIAETVPNDLNPNLWGLNNTGQTGGTPDADIDAPQAWDIQTGSSDVVIAVIDTGVDYNHVDLAANMWTNPGEIPANGVDDDGNGYIDDVHGYDFCSYDSDPMDDHSHGTHCAGTIAAVGDNGVGVVGVNWKARIMALKFLTASGAGYTSDAVAAVQYVIAMKEKGIPIIAMSNSWGGGGNSVSLEDAVTAANDAGILFIAAAGNNGMNTDIYPYYPAGFDVPNVISVAATDHSDNLAYFSNYGQASVDLAAPGVDIFSTIPGGAYGYKSGTSMATPHVSGVASLIKAQFPDITHLEVKDRILGSVDPKPGLAGKTLMEGRLNAQNAVCGDSIPPAPPSGLVATPGDQLVTLYWHDNAGLVTYNVYRSLSSGGEYTNVAAGLADGEYIDTGLLNGTAYYYVVTAVRTSAGQESKLSNEVSAVPTDIHTKALSVLNDSLVYYSDDNWHVLRSGEYAYFYFDDFAVPVGRVITSVVIYVEHREDDRSIGQLEWIVEGVSKTDVPLHTEDQVDSWDVTAIVGSPRLLDLHIYIRNNSTRRTYTDHVYALVEWDIPDDEPPAQVEGLHAATLSSSCLALSWDPNTEEDLHHYNVYRSTTPGGPYDSVASPTTNSYSDSGLASSTTYHYVVGAVDKSRNQGHCSEETSATTNASESPVIYIRGIKFSSKVTGRNRTLYIDVEVVEGNSRPAGNVEVDMDLNWSDKRNWNCTGTTGSDGIVRFTKSKADVGIYTATVTGLTLVGYTWDRGKGVTSSTCELSDDGTVIQGIAPDLAAFKLLQNNPNPFNPETWIPYVLAKPERVTIRIYDITGRLVKTLDLGDRAAGAYISKEKAAYWDGANENGENVSSGVYFYTLEAGSFRAAERMVITR